MAGMPVGSTISGLLLPLAMLLLAATTGANPAVNIWPIPSKVTWGEGVLALQNDCPFQFKITPEGAASPHIRQLISFYYPKLVSPKTVCQHQFWDGEAPSERQQIVELVLSDHSALYMADGTDESYEISVDVGLSAIKANSYPGLARGLESWSQLVFHDPSNRSTSIAHLPIQIKDAPRFSYRGLMVDTSRHFISVEQLKTIMDAMAYSKLNVLHWHLSDSDSFSIQLQEYPELCPSAHEASCYSLADVDGLTEYAAIRGIRIIPEVDAPAHTTSWAKSPAVDPLVLCKTVKAGAPKGIPLGQLDPSQPDTFKHLNQINQAIRRLFWRWNWFHFGMDEVEADCWMKDQNIVNWMHQNGFESTTDVLSFYMQQLDRNHMRNTMFWANQPDPHLRHQTGDILQYWGSAAKLANFIAAFPNNRLVLSPYDHVYLDCGAGNYFGADSWCEPFKSWLKIYQWEPTQWLSADGSTLTGALHNVLGVEACMWTELVNDSVVIGKIFPRVTAMAGRLWTDLDVLQKVSVKLVAVRLNRWIDTMAQRGIQMGPITSGYCEHHPEACFSDGDPAS